MFINLTHTLWVVIPMSANPKKEKGGYRLLTKTEQFDYMLMKAMEPCRKARCYSRLAQS